MARRVFQERLNRTADDIQHHRVLQLLLGSLGPVLYETAALVLLLLGLGFLWAREVSNPAPFIAVILLLFRATQYGRSAQELYHHLSDLVPYIEDLERKTQTFASHKRVTGARAFSPFGEIRFEGVSFEYHPGTAALHDVSFVVNSGDALGIIGPSGAGKSTLLDLLLGLRTPTSGKILFDGIDMGEFEEESFAAEVASAPQDANVEEETIAANILFHREWIPVDRLRAAAEEAGLSNDVAQMKSGLGTELGPSGSGLSGGQRQRLGLARALAGQPSLLVLDEPTAALDVHSELVVTRTLEAMRGKVTVVVVAHRLSTLRACDRILVLRGGKVDACGTREELAGNEYFLSAVELAGLT